MFIVSLTYTADLNEVDKHLSAHVDYLEHYYQQRIFLLSGRKEPRTGGVILVNLNSRAELDAILAQDPFALAGVADYLVTEFTPSKSIAALDFLVN
ncbi:hypothetical protein tinsulaeT_02430 [Thalassotalea insulae]|uniref:YCII-related domain-containing protein n=1 Tax=Thalassotalea insulae TaxID=2056778 RepID=A0ABQ6GLM5_9GAMM|nr:YciI family protein [Thalassotalea insulae]GLX76903.1 hypothetical protein tinsulaeT_02430 [Thalassotalea insulae]